MTRNSPHFANKEIPKSGRSSTHRRRGCSSSRGRPGSARMRRSRSSKTCIRMLATLSPTTRSMRDNETDGVHYRFLDRDDFERKIEQGYFIEHEPVYENLYGVPKRPIVDGLASGQHVIVKVDVKGAKSLRKLIPEAVSIFLLPETMEALWQRLNDRKTEPFDVML